MSSPGAIDWKVPPTTPAIPASPAPNAKTPMNTSWMRTPVADSIELSSTPARTSMPTRVLLSSIHMAIPMATDAAKMTMRTRGYFRNIRSPEDLFTPVTKKVSMGPDSQFGAAIL